MSFPEETEEPECTAVEGICPICRRERPIENGVMRTHDHPVPCRAVCRGTGLPPVESVSGGP